MARALGLVAAGVIGFLLLLEAMFRLLPVSTSTLTGYYFDPHILTYPAHHEWRSATGWDLRNAQVMRSNNFGFVAEHDFVRNEHAIALIGDSYVEASMLPAADRLGAQLERALKGRRPVYAMGSPGTALLDYAERVRFARQRLGIRDVVILMERGDVRQSLCGSGNVHYACLEPQSLAAATDRRHSPTLVKRLLRHSALAQYLTSQLKLEPMRLWTRLFSRTSPVGPAPPSGSAGSVGASESSFRVVDAVFRAFMERVQTSTPGRTVIVLDSPRHGGAMTSTRETSERRYFLSLARGAGFAVVDTEPLYRAHYQRSSLSLDVSPQDGHLNSLGLQIIAQAAAKALE
jgi:hypothetical protein